MRIQVPEELTNYLTKALKGGYLHEDLTRTLLLRGWSQQEIDDAYAAIGNVTVEQTGAPPPPPLRYTTVAHAVHHTSSPYPVQTNAYRPANKNLPVRRRKQKNVFSVLFFCIVVGVVAWMISQGFIKDTFSSPGVFAIPSATSTFPVLSQGTIRTSAATTTATTQAPIQSSTTVITSLEASNTGVESSSIPNCTTRTCFAPYFSSCTTAKFEDATQFWDVTYTIVQPGSRGCEIGMMYTTYPQPKFENHPMLCTFDTTLDFSSAVQHVLNSLLQGDSDCIGPLVPLLRS